MKRILSLIAALLIPISAYAGACEQTVQGVFTSEEATELCDNFPVLSSTNSLTVPAGITATTGNITSTAGSFVASTSGGTLHLQEATAGAKCMGTVTGTGTTAVVVSTTCAATGSRIFVSRTSAPSGTAQCFTANIVANTSFEFDCDGAETGTFNWFIIKEAA